MSSLAQKLRLPEGGRVSIVNAPPGYLDRLGISAPSHGPDLDFIQLFVKDKDELRRLGPGTIGSVKTSGLLWITYPKSGKTRGATDLPATPWWHRGDVLDEITGVTGYLPLAQVSIDDHWTALRFKPAREGMSTMWPEGRASISGRSRQLSDRRAQVDLHTRVDLLQLGVVQQAAHRHARVGVEHVDGVGLGRQPLRLAPKS
ncbi:MAG: hypothetical protein ACR2MZ_07725 [Candidatus Dormibacter sp.]|uniref:hypothetical protein n=1 Tax=Candidatus Dormibacter sp. TaxID=2973982 RepID=UPI003D9B37B0